MTDLVLLPGLHGDAQTWAPVMRALPNGVHAMPLDLPAVADLDALVDEVAGRVAPGSVVSETRAGVHRPGQRRHRLRVSHR